MSQCGALSKLDIQYMDMKHVGEMRLDPESNKWLSAKATQRVGVLEPGFAWQVKADVAPGLRVLGLDSLIEKRAEMVIRLLGVFPVANVKDTPEVNESTMHRYLLEMGWYPQLALHKDISWTAIDKNTAKASLQAGDSDVSVIIESMIRGNLSDQRPIAITMARMTFKDVLLKVVLQVTLSLMVWRFHVKWRRLGCLNRVHSNGTRSRSYRLSFTRKHFMFS